MGSRITCVKDRRVSCSSDGCRAVRRRGEAVPVGVPWEKRVDMPAFDVLDAVYHNYAILRSGWKGEVPRQREDFWTGSICDNLGAAIEWIAAGRVRVDGLWDARAPRDCQAAYQDLLKGRCQKLSVLLDWRGLSAQGADTGKHRRKPGSTPPSPAES